jgi:hypothetical protein
MKPLLFATLAMLTCGSAALARPDRDSQARLDRALAGRIAGDPVDCLRLHDIRSSQIIDGIGILYEGRGGVLYLNRPRSGASLLRTDEILVTDTRTSELCSIDTVKLIDNAGHFPMGFIGLGQFIPYAGPRATSERMNR